MNDAILKIQELNWNYGENKVLDNISVSIEEGSFTTILGPNGCGKTTLLRNISTALIPKKGKVFLKGKDIYTIGKKELAKIIAYVPQNTIIDFGFTALDIVLMGRYPYLNRFQNEGVEDIKVARKAMELTETWELKDRYINELSGGERQRIVVARALAQQPEVLLLDEPTSHLDIHHQVELLSFIKQLNREKGLTVIAVLHDINLAAQFSDYILLLKDGIIKYKGTPNDIIKRENISHVYDIDVIITDNPANDCPHVIPLIEKVKIVKKRDSKIFVICGGGSGSYIIEQLNKRGYRILTGALNIGDTDWRTAKTLDVEVVEEEPFSPITDEVYNKCIQAASKCDAIILMNTYFGKGNLKNLKILLETELRYIPVLAIDDESISERDFTNNKAFEIIEQLKGRELITWVEEKRDIIKLVESRYQ